MSQLPTIFAVSDLHLDTGPFEWPDAAMQADIIVVAGDLSDGQFDIDFLKKPGKPLIFVPGNHDFWVPQGKTDMFEMYAAMKAKTIGTQVHVLWDEEVVIDGVRFLGTPLWSDFGGYNDDLVAAAFVHNRDYRYISAKSWYDNPENLAKHQAHNQRFHGIDGTDPATTGQFTPLIAYDLHTKSIEWLERTLQVPFDGPTVLVTHMAPTYKCMEVTGAVPLHRLDPANWEMRGRDNTELAKVASFAANLDWLFDIYRAELDLAIHGHLHYSIDTVCKSTRIVANPRGRYSGPLTEQSARHISLFGVHLQEEDIARSQQAFHDYPYWGDNWSFAPTKLIRLQDGLAPALQPLVDKVLPQLESLLQEMREMQTFVGHRNAVIRRSIQESAFARGEKFEALLNEVLRAAGEGFNLFTAQPSSAGAMLSAMHLSGLSRNIIPYFDSYFDEPADPHKHMADSIAMMALAVELLPKVPVAAELARNKLLPKVAQVEEFLRGKGVSRGVEGPASKPYWRTIPFSLGKVYVDDHITERLFEQVDTLLNNGRIPRSFIIDVFETAPPKPRDPNSW